MAVLEPRYTVAPYHNGFVKYHQRLVSFEDQRRLSHLIDEIRDIGAYYIPTNASHVTIVELFETGDCRLETARRSSIGGFNTERGAATEYLPTNLI